MDRHEPLLARNTLLLMLGKAKGGPLAMEAVHRHGGAYLAAVGAAAWLLSKAIRQSRVVAFADLCMEAIHEFELVDFPIPIPIPVAVGTPVLLEVRLPRHCAWHRQHLSASARGEGDAVSTGRRLQWP